jgi:KipI family sensor histidine kinase inhibitor
VRLGDGISPTIHRRVLALLAALDAAPPAALVDLTPTYAALLVQFDPGRTSAEAIATHVRAALATRASQPRRRGRLVRIPVHYCGADGPDLEALAREVGLSPEQVVRLHSSVDYRVYFVGFVAGFPYLGGLPPELAASRLPSPRPRVPAGSVGIGGRQTGIYPVASPGGFRLIGRTSVILFDPAADPPALLRPGDRVRFLPVPAPASAPAAPAPLPAPAVPEGAVPWLRVLRPGPLTTVQDLGRPGYARYGVCASGAADRDVLRLGNLLLGNPPGAAALEVTLGGLVAEAQGECAVAVTGAEGAVRVNGRAAPLGTVLALAAGDRLELDAPRRGVRTYLAVAGGVAVPLVLGSVATDVRAGMGGYGGRALLAGDVIARGTAAIRRPSPGHHLPPDPARQFPAPPEPWRLRVTPGPHAVLAGDLLDRLVASEFTVDARSDRVGVRLAHAHGESGPPGTTGELLSEGVPRGAIQVPPGGAPVILLTDHQTTGGYLVPVVVIAADLWKVAQLRPGDAVRLELVAPEAALAALRSREAWLAALAAGGGAEARESVAPERLMRGFSEWSEEAMQDG